MVPITTTANTPKIATLMIKAGISIEIGSFPLPGEPLAGLLLVYASMAVAVLTTPASFLRHW